MTEQELIDFAIDQAVPALQEIENIESNTSELLELYKSELADKEKKALEELQALEKVEETGEVEELAVEDTEEELIIDYDPLVLEQLEILNAHMEVTHELQDKQNQIGSETAFLMVVTIAVAIAVKVFVDQITKW